MLEALEQRLGVEGPEPRRGELERERQPVETPADLGDDRFVRGRELERRGARHEERHGGVELERRESVVPLRGDPQRRPARGHDSQLGAGLDQASHLRRSGGDDLLEIVEEQERRPVPEQRLDSVGERTSLRLLHVERLRERGDEACLVGHVRHGHERDAVHEFRSEQPPELGEHARLADPARAGDRDDAVIAGEVGEERQIGRSTDERGRGYRQLGRQERESLSLALERLRIGHHETLGGDGVELERPADVLEPELSERDDRDIATIPELCVRVVREHHRSGRGERLDPRGDVDGIAGEPLGLDDHLAHVDPDPGRDILGGELLLDGHPRPRSGERAREHAHAPVAEPLDDRAAELRMMPFERGEVALALVDAELLVRLQQRRVPDHVGEHHGDEPAVELSVHAATLLRLGSIL